jgi:hypothetical protein
LGLPNYAVPFLAPNATGKALLYGVNYASGGGGIMNATGRIFVSIYYSTLTRIFISLHLLTSFFLSFWKKQKNFWLGKRDIYMFT